MINELLLTENFEVIGVAEHEEGLAINLSELSDFDLDCMLNFKTIDNSCPVVEELQYLI